VLTLTGLDGRIRFQMLGGLSGFARGKVDSETAAAAQQALSALVESRISPTAVFKKLSGRPEWTRTIDLFRVKEAL
jgi:hypothetical protein